MKPFKVVTDKRINEGFRPFYVYISLIGLAENPPPPFIKIKWAVPKG